MNIEEALDNLQPASDSDWTEDGWPALDVMQTLTDNKALTRAQIIDARPDFRRVKPDPTPKPEEPETDTKKTRYEELCEEYSRQCDVVKGLEKEHAQVKRKLDQEAKLLENLGQAKYTLKPQTTFQQSVAQYQQAQANMKRNRIERVKKLRDLGIRKSDLSFEAPIEHRGN